MHEPYSDIKKIGSLSPDGVFIYSLDKKIFTYSNKPFDELFGTSGKLPMEQSYEVLRNMLTEDEAWLNAKYQQLIEQGFLKDAELRLRFDDKLTHHLCCNIYMLDNTTAAGIVKDVTKEKEHENYIVEYTAKKDAFLDMITHNLSGPLIMSKDILSWMQRSVQKNHVEDVQSLLNLLQDTTEQCIEIIDDFLKEEHVESQTIFVKKTRINILSKVHAVLEKLQEMNPDKEFHLITNLENVNLNTDSVKFFQIIHNLLSNAIKFTDEKGKIEIKIDEEEDAFVFAVRDDGIGIPKELQQYMFDKRSYAGRDGLKGEKSNGIGLSIVKKLVTLLDGEIWFESQEKTGTAFFIRLKKD